MNHLHNIEWKEAKIVNADLQPQEHFYKRVIAPNYLDELVTRNIIDDYN